MINITQGDALSLVLRIPDQDLTGATLTTAFTNDDNTTLSIANGAHTIDADQSANTGQFSVALTALQTASLKRGRSSIVTKVVQTGVTRQFKGTDILAVEPSPF